MVFALNQSNHIGIGLKIYYKAGTMSGSGLCYLKPVQNQYVATFVVNNQLDTKTTLIVGI